MDEQLSREAAQAVHSIRDAAQATELARQAQLADAITETAQQTQRAVLQGLKEIFGDMDSQNPGHMKILVHRIPILCTSVMQMHDDIKDLKDNQKWVTRAIIGGVIAAVFALIMK